MANINVNELTKEQIAKAMACETAEELMAVAKAEGVELTPEEAEAYLAELADFELDEAELKNAAGGRMPPCPNHRPCSEREWFAGW
jgi:ribosomal protein L12E/L44/L45/RPP1/RPP2